MNAQDSISGLLRESGNQATQSESLVVLRALSAEALEALDELASAAENN
jgi:hypothetical protein